MKKILKNKIINIENTDIFDNIFNFSVINYKDSPIIPFIKGDEHSNEIEIIYLSELLEKKKNLDMLEKAQTKFASYSNVYSPEDELEIFRQIFDDAILNNKKIHIIGITLKEELEILEKYYFDLGFFNEEINCFDIDFSKVLVSVSVKIENLMWRGSDYKRMGKQIFFNPPIRESGQVKAMFKGINRGVIAGISHPQPLPLKEGNISSKIKEFFKIQILEENILPIILAKVLKYNLIDFGIKGESIDMEIEF